MLGFEESLSEWESMPFVLRIEESASVTGLPPHLLFLLHTKLTFSLRSSAPRPSSVAELRVLYAYRPD